MIVAVRLFARARDLACLDVLEVVLPDGATVADLRRAVAKITPALADLLARSALAINEEFADDDVVIPPKAEVALIPPVSGGAW